MARNPNMNTTPEKDLAGNNLRAAGDKPPGTWLMRKDSEGDFSTKNLR